MCIRDRPGTDRCFLPDARGRCRFLNEKNLCTAYLRVGEQAMAEICREHPRFHNWYADVLETGLGLCCEETARLILTTPGPFTLTGLPADEWEALLTLGESTPSAFLSPSASPEEEAELARIGVYLIYRYFLPLALDGDLCSPLCLSLIHI